MVVCRCFGHLAIHSVYPLYTYFMKVKHLKYSNKKIKSLVLANSCNCGEGTLKCMNEDLCIPTTKVCDGHKDCLMGNDEADCRKLICSCDT